MNIFTKKHLYISTIALTGVLFVALIFIAPKVANAIDSSAVGFNAGNIIDDYVMTNKNTMSVSQIQSFLNSKVTACDTNGTQTSEYGGGTRAQWAANQSLHPNIPAFYPPFTCLKDYSQNGSSAAQIIYNIAQAYNINPQVLIVVLQKEQGLVTDTWPGPHQYKTATGYGCPDTAACDSQYFGFTNQLTNTAKMFHAIEIASPTWYTPYILGNNTIQYNPTASCGSSVVNIQNRATQALYNYTPYQPNAATLNAPMGTTVSCGAYGNLNFYRYFTQWFGSTQGFVSLDTPRWMVLPNATAKQNPGTGQDVGDPIPSGTQLFFVDKIFVNGTWYLRTSYDSANGSYAGIPVQDLADIQPVVLDTPRYMRLTSDRNKWNPITGIVNTAAKIPAGTDLFFVDKVYINGAYYYRTTYDKNANSSAYITATALQDIPYTDFDEPRYMQITNNTNEVDPVTNTTGNAISSNTQLKFASKILVNGVYYYRTETNTSSNAPAAIPAKDITEVPYQNLEAPKWMQLNTSSYRYNPRTQSQLNDYVDKNNSPQILVSQQITINGSLYYRTAWSQQNNQDAVIPASALGDIPFVNLDTPRNMSLKTATSKVNPYTGQVAGAALPAGTVLPYATKVYVNGTWYLRTQSDTTNNIINAIPIYQLNS